MDPIRKCRDHLETVQESYIQHACFAGLFGLRLIGAGIAVILHALVPAIFTHAGSDTVHKLHDELLKRAAGQQDKHTP